MPDTTGWRCDWEEEEGECRRCQTEEEKQQDFFTSFRELTMEMRQNETRDERRKEREEKQRSEKKEERRGKEGLARAQRRVNRKG